MKRLLLIPAILAATAALGASQNALAEPIDAQSQAAALLSGMRTAGASERYDNGDVPSSPVSADAQASAVALLTGRSVSGQATTSVRIDPTSVVRMQGDAHSQAAALLSGSRIREARATVAPVAGK